MEAQSLNNGPESKCQKSWVLDLNQSGVLLLSPIKEEMDILEKVLLTG